MKKATKIIQVSILIAENGFSLIHEFLHIPKKGKFVLRRTALIRFLNFRGKTGEAGKEEHQILIEFLLPLRGNQNRTYPVAFGGEIDTIQSAVRCRNLILPSSRLVAKDSLQINRLIRQSLLVDILSF